MQASSKEFLKTCLILYKMHSNIIVIFPFVHRFLWEEIIDEFCIWIVTHHLALFFGRHKIVQMQVCTSIEMHFNSIFASFCHHHRYCISHCRSCRQDRDASNTNKVFVVTIVNIFHSITTDNFENNTAIRAIVNNIQKSSTFK